jgi:hypothetical protein
MNRTLLYLAGLASLLLLTGCGSRLSPVSGVVLLDGKPVAGASITLISDDGKHSATAQSDDNGRFTVETQTKPGAYPGNYKVVVAKYPKVENAISPALAGDPTKGNKDYEKQMKKEVDAGKTTLKAPAGLKMPAGAQGKMPPMPKSADLTSGAKSELPELYASADKTPLTIKVPVEGEVKLELKSKQ